jgi:dipeptidyl aminopeptidase/acylaminoacyl peptidase
VSRIEERAPDGAIREITAGPGDAAPAISPDGATLVFSRPAQHAGALQAELWHMDRRAGAAAAAVLVALPITDESGPVWSRDGRFVLATSVLRGAAGQPLFSSVIHIEVAARPPRARILRDRAGALVRLPPAVAAPRLDAAALRESPEYQRALADIVAGAIAGARREPDAAP